VYPACSSDPPSVAATEREHRNRESLRLTDYVG